MLWFLNKIQGMSFDLTCMYNVFARTKYLSHGLCICNKHTHLCFEVEYVIMYNDGMYLASFRRFFS